MQTNLNTLSCLLMTPAIVRPSHIRTPIIGDSAILATAKALMAPTGIARQAVTLIGTFSLARAEPRQIKPNGTLAAPTNVAVSITKASGGWPSGAFGMCEPGTETNKPLIGLMREITNEMMIDIDGGESSEIMNERALVRNRWRNGSFVRGETGAFSEKRTALGCVSLEEACGSPCVTVSTWVTVGAREVTGDIISSGVGEPAS